MPKLIESLALSGVVQTDGTPNASGKVWVYVRGSSTFASIYTDAEGDAVTGQPVVLDAAGRAAIYVDQPVSLHIENAAGATLDDVDLVDAPGPIRVANNAFTGAKADGSQGAGGETDLDTVLTRSMTSLGGTDFQYLESAGATARNVSAWMREVHISVKDFGAVGDGVHDDTSAIQAAINRVVALNGGVVYFPPGRYILSAALTNVSAVAVSFQGSGAYNCCLQQTSVTATVLAVGNSNQIGWWIADLNFTANPGTSGAAISMTGSGPELVEIRGCYVSNHSTCINLSPTSFALEISIHDNLLSANSAGTAINIGGSGIDRFTVRDNTLFAVSGTAINFTKHLSQASIYGNRIGASVGLALPSQSVSSPTLFFANYRLTAFTITQAGSTAYFKQWANGIDGQSVTDGVNTSNTPDFTAGEELLINVNVGALTITVPLPNLVPIYRGATMTFKLWNNNAGSTTWSMSGSYKRNASSPNINTSAGIMTTIVFEYDLDRTAWIEKSRMETA